MYHEPVQLRESADEAADAGRLDLGNDVLLYVSVWVRHELQVVTHCRCGGLTRFAEHRRRVPRQVGELVHLELPSVKATESGDQCGHRQF